MDKRATEARSIVKSFLTKPKHFPNLNSYKKCKLSYMLNYIFPIKTRTKFIIVSTAQHNKLRNSQRENSQIRILHTPQ